MPITQVTKSRMPPRIKTKNTIHLNMAGYENNGTQDLPLPS
jgi:hypothetical protein